MGRPRATAESKARAERIARALAGMLDEPPAASAGEGEARGSTSRSRSTAEAARPRPEGAALGGEALQCPCCAAAMHAVGMSQGVEVDQCLECGAVWLDAGELEALLVEPHAEAGAEPTVASVPELRQRMAGVLPGEKAVRYRECPRCKEVMVRRNFGTISGVVVDECPRHGVLLDEGELQAIETFVRIGGQKLGDEARVEQGLRSLPPPPEPYFRPGEVRRTVRGEVEEMVVPSLAASIWNTLFRW